MYRCLAFGTRTFPKALEGPFSFPALLTVYVKKNYSTERGAYRREATGKFRKWGFSGESAGNRKSSWKICSSFHIVGIGAHVWTQTWDGWGVSSPLTLLRRIIPVRSFAQNHGISIASSRPWRFWTNEKTGSLGDDVGEKWLWNEMLQSPPITNHWEASKRLIPLN